MWEGGLNPYSNNLKRWKFSDEITFTFMVERKFVVKKVQITLKTALEILCLFPSTSGICSCKRTHTHSKYYLRTNTQD